MIIIKPSYLELHEFKISLNSNNRFIEKSKKLIVIEPINQNTYKPKALEEKKLDDNFLQPETLPNNNKIYYASNEVSIKALPTSSLYLDELKDIPSSGLPIRLRVYVNSLGDVAKVEQLYVAELDEFAAIKLEEIIKKAGFLPAKKDGLDVNSYQDLEFLIKDISS